MLPTLEMGGASWDAVVYSPVSGCFVGAAKWLPVGNYYPARGKQLTWADSSGSLTGCRCRPPDPSSPASWHHVDLVIPAGTSHVEGGSVPRPGGPCEMEGLRHSSRDHFCFAQAHCGTSRPFFLAAGLVPGQWGPPF